MRALVTGGAGLVGSLLCERLLERGWSVTCVDNLVLGSKRHLENCLKNPLFEFLELDVSVPGWHQSLPAADQSYDLLAHLAANSDISLGHRSPEVDYQRTLATTFESLRAMRELKIPNIIFSSTSAVYGETQIFPTPERCPEMHPVSVYGAGKLASESFISAFVENYGLKAWVFRFGNVVGERLTHGVIYDFVHRLAKSPAQLDVLGNGLQNKTYIHVEDCVAGMLHAFDRAKAGDSHPTRFQIFNLSTSGSTTVREIAELVNQEVTGGKAQINYGESPRGWVGDVPKTSLDVSRISALGWKPKHSSTEAVANAVKEFSAWSRK